MMLLHKDINRSYTMQLTFHYTNHMVADAASYSPSAAKPAQVMESWAMLGLPMEVVEPAPVTEAQLCLAHDPEMVRAVLSGEKANGFSNRSLKVAASLPYTSGAMLSAARSALENGCGAIAPCSGFHHAGYAFVGGFCTFNGLMVTARVLLKEGKVKRIGILDFDQHWGDGTADIIKRLGLGDQVVHYSPYREYGRPQRAEAFVADIPRLLEAFAGCDLVLYQAGAAPHIEDPLGGWLTTLQLFNRDKQVFKTLRKMGIPVAWNLAGGYQRDESGGIRPVLDIHDNTLNAFAGVWGFIAKPDQLNEAV
jgi:acetoin utilization deacetylase AcuC-like enzyme